MSSLHSEVTVRLPAVAATAAGLWTLAVAGCSGSGSGVPARPIPVTVPRAEAAVVTGDADRLAAELLLAAGAVQAAPQRVPFELADPELAAEIEVAALDHLRSVGLGAGTGPGLAGSLRIRRLAQEVGAPPDTNGNGRNWDETLAAENARINSFAGAARAPGAQPLFPWLAAGVEPQRPLLPAADPEPTSWQTVRSGLPVVRLEHIGGAFTARALAGGRLLEVGRGTLAGATRDEGQLGLLLVQQLLAAEETIAGALFTAGGPLGGLGDLRGYDPVAGLRWLPAEVEVVLDGLLPEAPGSYRARDVASDLGALAAMLEGCVELAWIAGEPNPSAPLRAVFQGQPFVPPDPGPPPPHVLNWQQDISQLITFRCGGCHLGFPTGGFQVDTLQMVLDGSPRTRLMNLPMVVPGNHAASFLHTILVGPPPPFQRMPQGSSLPAAEIQEIADWIDAGALEFPPDPPAPPVPGADLARVCFVDLVAMHFDRASGALHHRHEGDAASGIATAVATGRTLTALRALASVLPEMSHDGLTATDVLSLAADYAATRLVDQDGRCLRDVAHGGGGNPEPAELAGQAALTAGLLAAGEVLPEGHVARLASERAAARLLADFRGPDGRFRDDPGHPFARHAPAALADLLAALRLAAGVQVADADTALVELLRLLRPVLLFAEWDGHGEVLGDGVADTDRDGVPEPAAAGGASGRLPLLAAAILVGDPNAAAPPTADATWSQHVRPLLLAKCANCHLQGNEQGGYRLDTLRLADQAGQSGGILPLLVAGDPDGSLLYRKLVDRLPAVGAQMPLLGTPLDDRGRRLVRQWILDGASGR